MIEKYLPSISTYSGSIDHLILLIGALVGFWFLLCQGVFFYFIFRYRASQRAQRVRDRRGEGAQALGDHPPPAGARVRPLHHLRRRAGVGERQADPARDPLRDGSHHRAAVGLELRAPRAPTGSSTPTTTSRRWTSCTSVANQPYIYELQARDVLHDFSVPVFRLKQDAIPGRVIKGWFQATETGEFDIQCAEICGIGHGIMRGKHRHRDARAACGLDRGHTRRRPWPPATPAAPEEQRWLNRFPSRVHTPTTPTSITSRASSPSTCSPPTTR